MESLELLILQNLLYDEEYFLKVIPFLDHHLFKLYGYSVIAKIIKTRYSKHNERLTPELLGVIVKGITNISDDQYTSLIRSVEQVVVNPGKQPINELLDATEEYFRSQKISRSLSQAINEFDNKHSLDRKYVNDIEDSINYKLVENEEYDYQERFNERVEQYQEKGTRYEFPIIALNEATNGGMLPKSLSICMASTGGGKSIFLCNCASHLMKLGYNVLYITCEMSVEEIGKRIDASLLSIPQDVLINDSKPATLIDQMDSIDKSSWGKLWIKEYPAGTATSSMIRRDMEEIERKKDSHIDVLVVDYINLLATSRYSTKTASTYTLVKSIAEELRGIGQEMNLPVISATQSNRSALNKELKLDLGLEAVSESFGLPQTCDFMFNIITVDQADWKQNGYRLFKVLKNRWGDPKNEFIKVKISTGMARFEDIAGEHPRENKPTELDKDETKKQENSNSIDLASATEPVEKVEEANNVKEAINNMDTSIFG